MSWGGRLFRVGLKRTIAVKIRATDIRETSLEIIADASLDEWWSETVHQALAELWAKKLPARAQVTLTRSEEMIAIHGELSAVIQAHCDRCLEPFEQELVVPIEHFLLPARTDRHHTPRERELDAEDVEFGTYHNEIIELPKLLREQLVLALPLQFFCRPDCKGLCPHCGRNRNQQTCACHDAVALSPFAVLKTLKAES